MPSREACLRTRTYVVAASDGSAAAQVSSTQMSPSVSANSTQAKHEMSALLVAARETPSTEPVRRTRHHWGSE
jgi:hypothetical protein